MTISLSATRIAMCALVTAATILEPSGAAAVMLSPTGLGQVLIFPYYTAQNGFDTMLTIVNTKDRPKALKIRIMEGKNSRDVALLNVYLAANDVWVGGITSSSTGGARILLPDRSCTSPSPYNGGASVDFVNFAYSSGNADGGDTTVTRTREGHIEVVEMGVVTSAQIPRTGSSGATIAFDQAITHSDGVPVDCKAVDRAITVGGAFATGAVPEGGLTAPTGGLSGSASLINVADGTDYSYDAVALASFRDAPMHTPGFAASPSLGDASPRESTTITENGVIRSTWNAAGQLPADPVTAVLMRTSFNNEYVLDPDIAAATDWIITFPTKRFYVGADVVGGRRLFDRPFTSDFGPGGACESYTFNPFNRDELTLSGIVVGLRPPSTNAVCYSVNVAGFFSASGVLTSASQQASPSGLRVTVQPGFFNGWARMSFPAAALGDRNGRATRQIVDDAGVVYRGLPLAGFAVQRYVNGNVGGVLSNYGGSFVHKYEFDVR